MSVRPAASSRIHQSVPSLSNSAGSVVLAAGRRAHRKPSGAMFARQHLAAVHPRSVSGRGLQERRGIRRGSLREMLGSEAIDFGKNRSLIVVDLGFFECVSDGAAPKTPFERMDLCYAWGVVPNHHINPLSDRTRLEEVFRRSSRAAQPRGFCYFDLSRSHLTSFFSTIHRAGLPLRWIEYRANGPVCQQLFLTDLGGILS
jgi:hypothetical protein